MKKLIIVIFINFVQSFLWGQVTYDRSAMTLLFLDFKETHSTVLGSAFPKLQPPEKYFFNPVTTNEFTPGFKRQPLPAGLPLQFQMIPDQDLLKSLKDNKVGQRILSTWFNRQADGSHNVAVLKERGLYNANDNDYVQASASKRGAATLMDMGLKLVNQSYVLVFDFFDVMTMDEYYNKNETPAKSRISNGYKAKVRSYLFKLDFSEEVAANYFQKYWTTFDDLDRSKKVAAFNNADFTFQVLGKQYVEVEATQYNSTESNPAIKIKTREQLMDEMMRSAMEKINAQIEVQHQDLRVKAMVSSIHPISAKIGKKEGLGFDQRYFVYEKRMDKNGSVYQERIAVIKSMKVADNRKVASGDGEVSQFYQIASGKVDNMGMYLEQHNDAGVNIFLGYTFKGLIGYTGRLEYYFSKLMGDLVPNGKSGKGLTSLKMYVEGAYGKNNYTVDSIESQYTFTRVNFGLGKDFYPLHFMHWGPYVGYGLEFTDIKGSNLKIETDFAEAGVRLGINLRYNVQLIGSACYNFLVSSKIMDKDDAVINEKFDYNKNFKDRMGLGASAGLRIMF